MRLIVFILSGAIALALVVALLQGADCQEVQPENQEAPSLPKLFDFQFYKKSFSKRYKSTLESMARRKYFLARAFRVYVAAVKYRFRQMSHYLAINEMSDYSPKEVGMMHNKVESKKERRKELAAAKGKEKEDQVEIVPPEVELPKADELDLTDDQVKAELNKIVDQHSDEPTYRELLEQPKHASRRKRSTYSMDRNVKLRDLPIEDIYKVYDHKSELLSESQNQKVRVKIPSDNPHYVPIELASKGLDDQQERINWYRIKGKDEAVLEQNNFLSSLNHLMNEAENKVGLKKTDQEDDEYFEDATGKPDEVFVDHRGKCMGMVRQQGTCGSCYAFAAISLLEWLYCRRTGTFTPLSEQYIIDCGKYIRGLSGCEGGDRLSVVDFIHNFGAELRVLYPYRERQDQCPYPKSIDLKTTGYIRPNLGSAVIVPRKKWPNYVKHTPMMTSIFASSDFLDYGGGVHVLSDCNKDDGHAMLLVGHGREDGKEYWLFRNSYSVGWGEKGYYKLAKKSDPKCIFREAYAIGSSNGVKFDASPELNKLNEGAHLKRHNQALMAKDLASGVF